MSAHACPHLRADESEAAKQPTFDPWRHSDCQACKMWSVLHAKRPKHAKAYPCCCDTHVSVWMLCEMKVMLTHTAKPWGLMRMTAGLTLTPMGRICAPLGATLMTCRAESVRHAMRPHYAERRTSLL